MIFFQLAHPLLYIISTRDQTDQQTNKFLTLEVIMKKTIIIISSFLLVAFVAGSVFAWGSDSERRMNWNSGQNSVSDLSKEQTDELSALRQKFIDETYEIRSEKFGKQQEIRMLMETSNPDRDKLIKLTKQISKLQNQMSEKQIDFQLAAKKIAPELNMGRGFGQRRGKGSKRGGQGNCQGQENCQGQGQGCGNY
jgi:zinc resistance-associated protein